MNNRELMIQLIIKLIDLTKEEKIKWKIDSNFNRISSNQKLENVFITELEEKKLRLYFVSTLSFNSSWLITRSVSKNEIKLEIYDDDIFVEFPDTNLLTTLYNLVRKNNLDIESWMNLILEKYNKED